MGRPPFTQPTERPIDSSLREGNQETASSIDGVGDAEETTVITLDEGSDLAIDTVSVYPGEDPADLSYRWELRVEDGSGTEQFSDVGARIEGQWRPYSPPVFVDETNTAKLEVYHTEGTTKIFGSFVQYREV